MHTEKVRYKFVQLWPNNKNSNVQLPSIAGQKSVRFLNPTVSRQYRLSKSADSSRKQEAPVYSSYDSRSNSCSCGPQNRFKATVHGRLFSLVNNKTLSHSNKSLQHSYEDSCKF
ncbi:uncharacterized protein LOC143458779 isoform X2 [Clavelina lepadiformis]|uniref:uncharacterized protein LOC143458779 isoform X2 n=1 Tax=Clavelina lepadiformis TaxID=159417 RepID=UPI0040429203